MKRTLSALAAALFFAGGGLTGPAQAEMKPEERAELRSEIRNYLLEHPEVIMEAVRILEARQELEKANADRQLVADNADALFDDGFSFVAGARNGDVTVVEFLDYACGYCKRAHNEVKSLLQMDRRVRYVVKEFPILGPASTIAAQAAMAAIKQDGGENYLRFNDALMRHQGRLSEDVIWLLAERAGLDVDRLRTDAQSADIRDNLQRTAALAQTLDIRGTPAFVIGDTVVRGYIPLAQLVDTVNLARRAANQ